MANNPVKVVSNPDAQIQGCPMPWNGGTIIVVPALSMNGGLPVGTSLAPGNWIISSEDEYVLIVDTQPDQPPTLVLYQVMGSQAPSSGWFMGRNL